MTLLQKTRPNPHRFQLQTPIKVLRMECSNSGWIIWITANGDFTLGSFVKLWYDGHITLNTLHPDGCETEVEISG